MESGTLLPALCDAHVHSGLIDLAAVKAGGIAAVWDLGSVPAAVRALRDLADQRLPTIRYAGPFLTAPGGYPSDRAWAAAGSWRAVGSATEAGEAVGEAHSLGATLIKVTAHTGGPLLPAATMTALVTAAHTRGLPVVVHAEGPGTVAAAYEAGADLLAHTPWTEVLDDGLIEACAGRMTWISTLDIHRGPAQATAIENLRRFHGHGGTVRYGTDLGNGDLPLGINPRELRALLAAGLSPKEILGAMTGDDRRERCRVPGGLDLDPERFPGSLATARVLAT
jgi:imidazolonepropionase-like amidohydrolase